jgi:PAS domain S-box-containing protein
MLTDVIIWWWPLSSKNTPVSSKRHPLCYFPNSDQNVRTMSINKPLRILHLEDEPDFSDLVRSLLEKDGLKVDLTLVATREDFEKALSKDDFDLILADYLLPTCNGLEALSAARKICPQKPFILVSGTIGDQAAIESLKAGATDYVLKMLPERLVPAIRRAAEEAEERRQRRRIETELVRREKYFRTLTENALDIVTVLSKEGGFLYNSPSVQRVLGHDPKNLIGKIAFDFVHPDDVARVVAGFETGLQHPERTITLEFRFRHSDGTWRYLEAVGQNRLDEPHIAAVVVNSRDITDRKIAEESLREGEKQYRLIFDGNPTPMWIFDQETLAFLEVNDAAMRNYGYSRDEFLAMKIADIRAPDEVPAMIEYLHKLVATRQIATTGLSGVWRHKKKDGALVDVEIRWNPVSFKGRAACLAMANDVTERKRLEHRDAALSKLGQSLSSATSAADAAEIIRGIASDLFRWDAFTLDLYSEERDLVFPTLNIDTDREGVRFTVPVSGRGQAPSGMARRIIEEGAELILRKEPLVMPGDTVPMGDASRPSASLMLAPVRNRTKVIGILSIQSYTLKAYDAQDLSTLQALADYCGGALERIHAEQALHLSEMRFHDLFEGSPDAIFVEDFDGKLLDVNPAGCQIHGATKEELIGKTVLDLVPPDTREKVALDFALLAEGRIHQIEGLSLAKDGGIVPVEVRANRIEYGGASALLLHVRDISERKAAEAAVRSSEMLFHSVWENSVDGMRLTDEQGNIVAVNDPFCKLLGVSREALEGKPLTVIYAAADAPQILEKYQQRFKERVVEKQVERRFTLPDGKIVTLEETGSFVELRGQPSLLLGIFRDVTAQKRLEEQLRQSQKMEAIGQLAGGVAHDFNNILTVIQGHASLLQASGGLTGVSARSAQQIAQAAERASGLTRQLLTFGRRQFMQLKCLDMNEVVGNMTKMLSRLLGEHIALQITYFNEPAPVQADASMMEQVLLNLAVNARDAMPQGGQLVIKIEVLEVDSWHVAQHHEAHAGRFVCVSTIDKGCGIVPENLRRIFEPFFTTKEVGKGTGLGLATVYGIVKQHQGWVEVESEVGKGTRFRVYLPCSTQSIGPSETTHVEKTVRGGTETILVVEDEAPVRELVCDLLAGHGYKILQAESGRKALDVWNESKDKIDLVLTDLVMPDRMNGRELAERLWVERPDLKVIFTSGYSAEVVGKDFVMRKGLNYLQKPYHPQRLASVVRDCLDAVN